MLRVCGQLNLEPLRTDVRPILITDKVGKEERKASFSNAQNEIRVLPLPRVLERSTDAPTV
jgi:hypothetical protein